MKIKTLTVLLVFALLLAACGGGQKAPSSEKAPTAAPTADVPEVTDEPEITPEPPSTVPDPTPAPEKNGMYDLLCGLMDGYHPGTAGSSLTAAWYAASIVDWAETHPGTETVSGAKAWDRPMVNDIGEAIKDKLDAVHAQALRLTVTDKGLLEDCGFDGPWDYSSHAVKSVFQSIYDTLGLSTPFMVLVWSPDDNAEGFVISVENASSFTPDGLNPVLADKVLLNGAAINGWSDLDGTLRVDMNAAFGAQIRSMGTSGEYLYLGSLVNTLLDARNVDSLILTVEGQPLETGHNVYDGPLTFFEEIG